MELVSVAGGEKADSDTDSDPDPDFSEEGMTVC